MGDLRKKYQPSGGNFTGENQGAEWEFVLDPGRIYLIRGRRLEGTGTLRALVKYKFYIEGLRELPLIT